ncbi:hypothetical protein NEFER03_2185 [Nematocida sp. LUAm3]|nr:hypothetical protein NEFER03_2185 [Nematocida sp. LUAm3]KAI5176293.1 hypothetical protein NEFER02_2085 [Nematocida sp. LUAm2]KAI5179235.1 hypothetical protein NEFER01_2089 [Nematocida sp. LUAm1]
MFNKETLSALPQDAKKEIAKAAEKLKKGEITREEYQEICSDLVDTHLEDESPHESKRGRPSAKDEQKQEYMSDIIHYAGVNLKEEAMHLAKEAERNFSFDDRKGIRKDHHNSVDSLFDPNLYTYFVNKICKLRDIGITDDAQQVLFQACRRKVFDLLEKLIYQSKVRVDSFRSDYLVRIENDRRRQMWFLEQEERLEMDKYRQKKDGEEGDGKKKWRKLLQEREDLIIKKRLSNNMVLAALGIHQKSWVNSGDQNTDDGSSSYLTLFQGGEDRAQKANTRLIIKEDLLAILSRDKRYNKSVFTIKHTLL